MKVSDYIVKFFEQKNIEYVFGYQGGMITHIIDSISKSSKIKFIQTYHEQSAALAAEGYARANNSIGVAVSTSGPGATNMVTGIANAYLDSIPVIYITGQVNSYDYKYDKKIRQQGFQELDIVSLTKNITKYSKLIDKKEDIPFELEKAYQIAMSGRKGPVVLDISMNVQREDIEEKFIKLEENSKKTKVEISEEVFDIIKNSKKPLLLLGSGIFSEDNQELIENIVSKYRIPVVTSLLGKGIISEEKDEYVGMVGSYGNRCANFAMGKCDCLIAVGTRLDNRQVGNLITEFVENKKIIHVDIDDNELENNRLENRIKVNLNAQKFLKSLLKNLDNFQITKEWKDYIKYVKENFNQSKEIEINVENKLPYQFLEKLNCYMKEGDIVTVDIGQNQMWAAQTLKLKDKQKWMTSGGLAPMGYSLPAAVGAAFANKGNNTFAIMGDGGFQIALQSLPLISQYNLPVKVIILNNKALGLITQFQELYFQSNMIGTTKAGGYLVPKLEKIAEAFTLEYIKITKDNLDDNELLNKIFSKNNILIEVEIEGLTKVYPKLEYNARIEDMSPKIKENYEFKK